MSESSASSESGTPSAASAITRRTHARLLPPALFIASVVTLIAYVAYRIYGAVHGNP